MALSTDNLTDREFSMAYKAQRASVVVTDDNMPYAQSLAAKGWGSIKLSDNFGALFKISDDAKKAFNRESCPHCGEMLD